MTPNTQSKADAPSRQATIERTTRETDIRVELNLDPTTPAPPSISTGLPFLDHMLTALATHARIDLTINATGDLQVDDHHTIEDVALTLAAAIDNALADRRAIERFATAHAPLDESLARAVIDLSGRPHATINLHLRRPNIGPVATENITHFFQSFATAARAALHLDILRGENDHHKAEAAFKALALALRVAIARTANDQSIPSTKGSL